MLTTDSCNVLAWYCLILLTFSRLVPCHSGSTSLAVCREFLITAHLRYILCVELFMNWSILPISFTNNSLALKEPNHYPSAKTPAKRNVVIWISWTTTPDNKIAIKPSEIKPCMFYGLKCLSGISSCLFIRYVCGPPRVVKSRLRYQT